MPLYAFIAPIQPNRAEDFRQFVKDLNGSRKAEYESSREKAGFRRESIFLQDTANGEMVVVIQEAESQRDALDSLRSIRSTSGTSRSSRTSTGSTSWAPTCP
jgi:hypothetical protein